jgi:hypothetical protein
VRRLVRLGVDKSINLDDQLRIVTIKVRDEPLDRKLAPKLQAAKPPAAQALPERFLGRSLLRAKRPRLLGIRRTRLAGKTCQANSTKTNLRHSTSCLLNDLSSSPSPGGWEGMGEGAMG